MNIHKQMSDVESGKAKWTSLMVKGEGREEVTSVIATMDTIKPS